ncbi:clasp N terminal-domain-containing protein [Cristinia sonorae]|uniref:Clasp N terminal-domain-containing protein n=1 Tax=Cristinia sonorae TaxID=1940300 RepID=A0A8K0UXH3_9AGAR|nr:clasp N terminal-domain-containing protein [Cristinia sonorae]
MDESRLEQLIVQCRSNDVDVRVDAVTKMQAEFEAGVEIPDPDALIAVLKACLRTANQHLSTATLSVFPPLLPLLTSRSSNNHASSQLNNLSPAASTSSIQSSVVDVYTLRQVLNALLPAGGVIDRLGDSREKAREKARETLAVLGGLAFRGGGSVMGKGTGGGKGQGPETPLMIFERLLRELGLGSKVWRVREQTILTLVHIRRAHHLFPIRPYLADLVAALEDSDATVRATAQSSVVELFTGPAVTDAARADLKKEMTKKGTRKGILESVLAKVLGGAGASTPHTGSDAGSENGESTNVPPSIALMNKRPGPSVVVSGTGPSKTSSTIRSEPSRPASRAALVSPAPPADPAASGNADVKPVYIASSRDLENEFASMLKPFDGKETEHNWAQREQAILRVRGMLKGEVHERFTETFLLGLKGGYIDASVKTLMSLRTTVASNTCSLYSELAMALGSNLEPFCDTLYHNLLRMASLTKKIIAQQSQATVDTIIANTSGQPRLLLPILWSTLQDKAIQPRVYAMGHMRVFMDAHSRAKQSIESAGGVDILEKAIKKGLTDPNPSVKEQARHCFWLFDATWKDKARVIIDSLDATSRKQLEKVCPNPEALNNVATAPATPASKKSSVAAAIAASRAKAKAIATAPPTLRHQATSAARTTSPPTKRVGSPSLSSSTSFSGSVRATSPIGRVASTTSSPPRTRVASGGTLSRSASAGFVPSRDSGKAKSPPSPPSPTPSSSFQRRISSPLVVPSSSTSHSTFKRAVETALPASPTLRPAKAGPPVPAFHRNSINITGFNASDEESLLLASNIPIPEDDGSDMDMDGDESINLISFSTPYERYQHPGSAASFSPRSSSSKPGASNALSTATSSPPGGMLPQPMVEDAMRARAEQAESAAERLLELVEPDEEGTPLPASLLLGSTQATPRMKTKTPIGRSVSRTVLKTPVNNKTDSAAAILRKAALFQDSPAPRNGGSAPSVFDMIDTRTIHSEWLAKRESLLNQTVSQVTAEPSDRRTELNASVSTLEKGLADVQVLQRLALLCKENPVNEPISPISPGWSDPLSPSPLFSKSSSSDLVLKSDLWTQEKAFDRLLNGLIKFLETNKNARDLEYGLVVLWEMLENQALFLEGREADIFAVLLRIRYCGLPSILQATIPFRDVLTQRIEPVYGLTTMHASVRFFRESPIPPDSNPEIKDGSYAFGLIALGKFMLRLPAEVLEDELPRLRATLIAALTDKSSTVVREAAAASIIAAQLVIQDETHVFTLLDGLPEDKKNLLAYLFDKHSSRGANGILGQSAIERLGKEILRLDQRTSQQSSRVTLQSPIVMS